MTEVQSNLMLGMMLATTMGEILTVCGQLKDPLQDMLTSSQKTSHWRQILCKYLTHLSRIEFPTVIKWTSPFLFKGLLGSKFQFHSNLKSTLCAQTVKNLIRRHVLCVRSGSAPFANVP